MSQFTSSREPYPTPLPPETAVKPAADAGLASLILGALLVIVSPITIIITILLASIGPARMNMGPPDIAYATVALIAGLVLIFVLGVFGLIFGIRSLLAARSRGQSRSLGWVGVITNSIGLVLWIMASVNLITVLLFWNRQFR
jgi:hypothetical protein